MKVKKAAQTDKRVDRRSIRARSITEREAAVLRLVALGYENREIAEELGITVKTVGTHRFKIMNKLALRNVADLIRYAIAMGIAPIEIE